jgi:ABC-type antimicrobial peptide transport system permease subunit
MALGASRRQIFGLVMSSAAAIAGIGVTLGIAGAFAVTRVIASQLYNVSPTDPFSFAATSLFLALVAIAASAVPAQRATTVDPNLSLRAD